MAPGFYTTAQAARKVGITRQALHLQITKGQVAPPRHKVGRALAWTDADIRRVQAAQPRIRKNKGGRPRSRQPK